MLAVVVFPSWVLGMLYWPMGETAFNTLLANTAAFFVGAYFLARLQQFPGMRNFYAVLPTIIFAWLLVFAALLLAR